MSHSMTGSLKSAKSTSVLILALLFAFAISTKAQAVAPKEGVAALRERLQAKLDELHRGGKFPGATLGVALTDGQSFGLATGFSDRETKTRMKPSDLMLQGSVGKTYAAALMMQLVREGKIKLDERIEKYLGREAWFARLPNAKEITIRMLMNHTSGLVRYEFKDDFTKDLTANVDKVWKPQELIAYIFDTKAPFEAGKGWDYSDTNYIVLGLIIEKVTGKRYYDLVDKRILQPLNLKNTVPSNSRTLRGLAQGYAGEGNPFGGTDAMIVNGKFAINPQFEWTGGGYASTTEDLARWAKAMYEGRAFDAGLLPEMLTGTLAPMLGKDAKYGLGVIIRPTTLGTAYGHSGFFPGYITEMIYLPEHRIALALQINSSVPRVAGKPPIRFLIEAAEIILGRSSHHLSLETADTGQQSE